MVAPKSIFGLFAIAAGGFLNSAVSTPSISQSSEPLPSAVMVSPPKTPASPDPADAAMQNRAKAAVLTAIRTDLNDQNSSLRMSEFRFDPASGETVEGNSRGMLLFDGTSSIPVVATVVYDTSEARVEHVSYSIAGKAGTSNTGPISRAVRDRIADVIGSRLVLEFSQQAVDFSLLNVRSVANGHERLLIDGDGITRFQGEGAAYTRFVAVADKSSGRIISITYDLQQQIGSSSEPVASLN
jgi:hypothetical protein